MNDDMIGDDELLAARLKAAARTATAVPRRRLILPSATARRRLPDWAFRHRVALALVGVNLLVASIAFAAGVGVKSLSSGQNAITAPATPSPSPSLGIVTTIPEAITPDPDPSEDLGGLAIGDGSIWVAAAGAGAVLRIDETTARVIASIPVGAARGTSTTDTYRRYPTSVAVAADGTVWATANAENAIVRIDPSVNRVVDTIGVGVEPTTLGVDGSTVWVGADQNHTILAIDTIQRRVVHQLSVVKVSRIVVADDAVWVVAKADGNILRLDRVTGRTEATVGSKPSYDYTWVGLTAGTGGLWAADYADGVVTRIDPNTAMPAQTIPIGAGARAIAVGSHVIWASMPHSVVRVDIASGAVTTIPLAEVTSLVPDGDSVWALVGGPSRIVHLVAPPRS